MAKTIKANELQEVLQEIEADLQKAYELEKDTLLKAEGDVSASPEASDSPEMSSLSAEGSSGSPESGSSPSAGMPPVAAPAATPAATPPAAPAESAPMDPAAGADQQGAPLTPEALQAEYAQLAPEELDMHIQAALSAKEALQASAAPAPDASMQPPASPSPSPSPAAPPAMKAEASAEASASPVAKEDVKVDKKAIGGKMVPVKKSEPEVDPRDAEIASLREDIEILTKSITMVMEQPLRKAVTSMAYVAKAPVEEPKKSFTSADVRQLIKDNAHKLTKSERDLVIDFYDGKVQASKLEAVLEKISK